MITEVIAPQATMVFGFSLGTFFRIAMAPVSVAAAPKITPHWLLNSLMKIMNVKKLIAKPIRKLVIFWTRVGDLVAIINC